MSKQENRKKPSVEVTDILKQHIVDYQKDYSLFPDHYKIVYDLLNCRTAYLGGHIEQCDQCGTQRIWYNSCRNRHCPKCQGAKRAEWVNKRLKELLPVYYYHAVFTMVHSLNIIALYNKEIFYDIMMRASAKTLQDFAADPKYLGAKIGFVGILHTWGQPLSQHIHAHFIIPGGGISTDDERWISLPYRKDFLFPVKAMSKRMRSTFSKMLQEAYDKGEIKCVMGTDAVFWGEKFNQNEPWYVEVSIAPLFARVIYNINTKRSVSELLR